MSEAGRTDRRDCGAAVIWVLACSAVLMVFAVVIATRTAAVFARHRAEAAADLAALAAAGQIGVGDEPCAAAAAIARRNVAAVGSCTVALDPGGRSGAVIVSVVAHVRLPVIGTQDVTASARAARLPDVAGRSEGAPAVRPGACAPVAGWRSRTSPESGFLTAGPTTADDWQEWQSRGSRGHEAGCAERARCRSNWRGGRLRCTRPA